MRPTRWSRAVAGIVPRALGAAVALLGVLGSGASLAGEAGESVAPELEVRRIVVKRYTELDPVTVWRATDGGARADVRFSDVYDVRALPSAALQTVTVGRDRYRIAVMFRTEGDLACLVPAEQTDTLTKVANLSKGQKIVVEGTTLGVTTTYRCVLVDRVLTGNDEKSDIEHQLVLSWPLSKETPKLIVKPGDYTIGFPCRYKEAQVEKVTVIVEQIPNKQFQALLAQMKGQAEPEKEKQYESFKAEAVYRLIGDGRGMLVSFNDRVKGAPPSTPPTMRLPNGITVRVGAAFETYTGITCLVNAEDSVLVDRAQRLVQGQDVTVKGTTLPAVGIYRPVLVDKLEVPGVQGRTETPDVWVVKVWWHQEDMKPKVFFDAGTYNIDFPCTNVEGKIERLAAELREVRVIKGRVEGEQTTGTAINPD